MPAARPWWTDRSPEQVAAVYQRVFENGEGAEVLEHLVALFHDRRTYVAGGLEAQRETERRAAQKEVIDFVLRKLGQSLSGDDADPVAGSGRGG